MSFYDRVFQRTNNIKKSFYDVDENSFKEIIWDYKILFQTNVLKQMN